MRTPPVLVCRPELNVLGADGEQAVGRVEARREGVALDAVRARELGDEPTRGALEDGFGGAVLLDSPLADDGDAGDPSAD